MVMWEVAPAGPRLPVATSFEVTLAAAAEGEHRAVRWVIDRYHPGMVEYAIRSGSPDPEGVVDLVMTRVLRRADRLEQPTEDSLELYLYRSLRREINREVARRPVDDTIDLDDPRRWDDDLLLPGFEETIDDADLLDTLLDQLTDRQRKVVVEYYLNDRDYDEIGLDLGQSPSAVRKTSSRAITKLRAALAAALALAVVAFVVTRTPAPTTIDMAPADSLDREGDPGADRSGGDGDERSTGRIATETTVAGQPDDGGADAPTNPPTTAAAPEPSTTTSTTPPAGQLTPPVSAVRRLTAESDPGFAQPLDVDFGDVVFSHAIGSVLQLGEPLVLNVSILSTGGREMTIELLALDGDQVTSRPSSPFTESVTVSQWIRFDGAAQLDRVRIVARDTRTGEAVVSKPLSVQYSWADLDADLDDDGDGGGDDTADDAGADPGDGGDDGTDDG